ncbi:hypothetical protein F5I97DRAFT_2076428 [Phlebopus sp. FC_14]|nr:hypothetical protein F5I97DRAFT_2076428 [Phlebopus sp. FC_14]
MSSPLPDGNYRIINVAYGNLDADLIDGYVIGGPTDSPSTTNVWTLKNVGANQVTLLNAYANNFASVLQQIKARRVRRWQPDRYHLALVVSSKANEYLQALIELVRITVGDAQELAWKLLGPWVGAPVQLEASVKSDTTENWTFEPV